MPTNCFRFVIFFNTFQAVLLLVGYVTAEQPAQADASELVLVDRGVAHASIVVPANCSEKVLVAAKDIQDTFERSTGVSLSIVDEGRATSGTRLLVGSGPWLPSLKVTIPTGTRFHDEQIIVKRIGSDVVIAGNDDGPLVGTQDAAIRFLNVAVGADFYYASPLGQAVPKTGRSTVGEIDLTERPALAARAMAMYGLKKGDPQRVIEDQWRRWNHFGGIPFAHNHAHRIIAPPKVYFKDHPEYYSEVRGERSVSRGWQLCTTNPEVIQLGVAYARNFLDERPSVIGASLSPNDGSGMCTCPECNKLDYPDPISRGARRMATYANAVARELAKTDPDKYVAFYAYLHTVEPPTDMKLEPNVIVVLADSRNCMFHSYDDASCGLARDARERLTRWSRIATTVKLYDYHGLHGEYAGLPFSNIHRLIANARVVQRIGGLGYYYDALFMPGPQGLHYWTALRTLWDAEMTADQARQRFCDGLYGDASPAMQTYYRHLETFCTKTAAHSVHVTWVMPGPLYIWTDEAIAHLRSDLENATAMVSSDSTESKRIGEQAGFVELAETFVHLKRLQRDLWHEDTPDHVSQYGKARHAYLDQYNVLKDQGLVVLRQNTLNACLPEDPRHKETSVEIRRTPKPPHPDPLNFSDPTWVRYGYRVYSFKDMDDYLAYPKTRGRLTYDDHALYIRLEAIEYNMSRLTTDVHDRDGDVWQDDCVRLSIAVPGQSKQQVRYDFFVNAAGVIRDVREGKVSWNGDWQATVGRSDVLGDRKWAVRMEIPWSTLGLSSVPRKFRLNLFRHATTGGVSPVSVWEPTFDSFDTASRYVEVTTVAP